MAANSNPTIGGGGSMSAVFTETESGWHVLKIERYSQIKGVFGVANPFTSAVFSAGGHRWHIGYYADGYAEDTDDCIGFELFLVDHPDDEEAMNDVKAKFVFTLLDQAGQPVPAYTAASEVGTFSSAVPSWGFESFIERTELESKYLNDDDSFSVRCDVTVFKDSRRENLITATPPPSRSCARVAVRLILWLILLVACRVVFRYIC
jgi:speckle-type POZ protein